DKNQLIIDRLAGLPDEQRGCRYITVLAIATLDGKVYRRTGTCTGLVARAPAGSGGFGYDPIFLVPDLGRTMAEIPQSAKAAISHRGRAVAKAMPLLRALLGG
ncbi:MAG: non-canonical purine NTP pyrophosphatase, partial [Chloroflexota bacterium]